MGTSKKYIFSILAAILVGVVCYIFSEAFIVFILAVLFSFILHPFVTFVEKKTTNRLLATIITFILILSIIYLAFYFFIPVLNYQVSEFLSKLKDFSLHKEIVKLDEELRKIMPSSPSGSITKKIEDGITEQLIRLMGSLANILSSVITVGAVLVIVPFISFFALKDSKKILKGIISVVPNRYFEMSYYIVKMLSLELGKYVRAWIFDASFVGVSLGLGFYAIGVPYALPLGLIAGFGHLIPYFGPVIGGLPALLISFVTFGNAGQFPFIFGLIVLIYIVDNGFVQPTIFSKNLNIHPIIIMLLIIAGSQIAGLVGMLFAIPTATLLKTFVKEVYFAFKRYKIAGG